MPGPKVHRSGYVFKKGGLIKSIKKRWLVLNEEELAYYESVEKMAGEPPIDRIYLRLVIAAEDTGKTEMISKKNYFEFIIKTNLGRDYQIYVETPEERSVWVDTINSLTHAFKSPVKSFEKVTDPNMYNKMAAVKN
ncbi:hypothetical protein FDP41_008723 [Naegleria fowleri]|uniref:PH domain-containing protein n=1 Tax=Naegleria fowleri TaxID=5763 RepID=A0A6A5BJ34_NAEFO|nr:uncharacterized protein FDP41_008723 [Naegleria fowleri]KAF0973059.1 hypothetical protein FDP41_008723 [Naegleria fowleri]CAG4713168.1 unnamed protein product [Naegleria fowleri]